MKRYRYEARAGEIETGEVDGWKTYRQDQVKFYVYGVRVPARAFQWLVENWPLTGWRTVSRENKP